MEQKLKSCSHTHKQTFVWIQPKIDALDKGAIGLAQFSANFSSHSGVEEKAIALFYWVFSPWFADGVIFKSGSHLVCKLTFEINCWQGIPPTFVRIIVLGLTL